MERCCGTLDAGMGLNGGPRFVGGAGAMGKLCDIAVED
jgi:hypothetical protein